VTKIVESVKLEDFTRIALAVPPSAAAAVRVGTQCRVNGAPLLVASVRPAGRDGRDVVATFGVAMNSPLTSNLSALKPDQEVRFEVDTEGAYDDVADAAAIKRARETQDGLPGTRQWYSNTLPWYTKMYPASEFEDSATDAPAADADGSGTTPASYRSPYESTYESPYESPYAPTENGASSSYANGIADVGENGSFSSSREARIIDGWSKSSESGSSTDGYGVSDGYRAARYEYDAPNGSETTAREDSDAVHASGSDGAYSYRSEAYDGTGTSLARPDPLGSASRDVVDALERLARRNSHLTDRVESLLNMIETKGFGDEEVMDGLTQLGDSRSGSRDEEEEEEATGEEGDVSAPAPDASEMTFSPTAEVCAVTHPGALCCTSSEITTDEEAGSATITLRAVVRAAEDAGVGRRMRSADYLALGAQAIRAKANELAETRTDAAVRDATKDQEEAHARITKLLHCGKITWVEAMGEVEGKYGHPCYRVRVECPDGTGAKVDAVFKPAIEGEGDGWHRASMEYVAYKLSRMLGMDLVPPAAYRTGGIELDYKTFDAGAFMYWVHGADELEKTGDYRTAVETGCWGRGVDPRAVLSDTRVLDVLLHNSDRHSGHFLFGRHWTEGGPDEGEGDGGASLGGSEWRPVLIDHAASFRREAFVSMEHENAFQTGPTTCVKANTYLRLRFLDAAAVKREFGFFLSEEEQRMLLERRDKILDYLDGLVEQRGYDDVVIH
jgi:hypothetical protein